MSLEKLKNLKEILEKKQQEKARLEGQLESAMDQLKALGYKTVADAEKAIKAMDKSLDKLDAEISDIVNKLEKRYAHLLEA